MEELGTTNPKYQPLAQCEFNGTRSCAQARKTIPIAPIHLFTRQIVYLHCINNHRPEVLCNQCKLPPSINNIFRCALLFFFVSFFHFHCTLFRGIAGASVTPEVFKLSFVHSFVYAITHLFLNGFQPNFYQHFSHVCPTCHTIFCL